MNNQAPYNVNHAFDFVREQRNNSYRDYFQHFHIPILLGLCEGFLNNTQNKSRFFQGALAIS
jgi:hypothetical protein